MSLVDTLLGRRKSEPVFNPNPEEIYQMPARPYTVRHDPLPYYLDPECRVEVRGARLIVLRSDDPKQDHHPVECVPTRKRYAKGQILMWEINHKLQWEEAWYVNPDTGNKEKAWVRAVEFTGYVFKG